MLQVSDMTAMLSHQSKKAQTLSTKNYDYLRWTRPMTDGGEADTGGSSFL